MAVSSTAPFSIAPLPCAEHERIPDFASAPLNRLEQAASSTRQHAASMNDEMVQAMNRMMTLKEDVTSALDKLKQTIRVNGSSSDSAA